MSRENQIKIKKVSSEQDIDNLQINDFIELAAFGVMRYGGEYDKQLRGLGQ